MSEHIVFTTEPIDPDNPDFADVEVLETYDFDGLYAAHLDCEQEHADALGEFSSVSGVYGNDEFTIDIAPPEIEPQVTTDKVVSEDDIEAVQDFPDDLASTGDGLSVVVMDSGRDPEAFDIEIPQNDMTDTGDNTDQVGHGTATGGLVHKLAPDASLQMLRIFGGEGSAKTNVILRGYQWLIQHADEFSLVNMSWGGQTDVPEIARLHKRLMEKSVLSVVSAGNSGGPSGSPATVEDAFSVGAITLDGELTEFSSYNPEDGNPDVCALGKDVLLKRSSDGTMGTPVSVGPDGEVEKDQDGNYVIASGTSFSAPIQTAMAALLFSNPNANASLADLAGLFERTSEDIPGTNHDGNGISQLEAAIAAASGSTGA